MKKATCKDTIIAASEQTVSLGGNQYFPAGSIVLTYFAPRDEQVFCPWKGTGSYYDIEIAGQVNPATVWYYPEPKPAASAIKDQIAFWQLRLLKPE